MQSATGGGTGRCLALSARFVLLGFLSLGLLLGCLNAPAPAATYVVTYNGNGSTGGSVPADARKYLPGQTVTVLGNTGSLVRTGFNFSGWNTQANGSGTTYSPSATFAMGKANVTLYALWTSPTPTAQYSLRALWSSPTLSDSLSLVTVSSRATRVPLSSLDIRPLSQIPPKETTNRIIVRYKDGTVKTQSLASRLLGYGKIVQSVATPTMMFDAMEVDTSGGRTVDDTLAYCRSLPEVAYAEPDGIVHILGTPNDAAFGRQWNFTQLNMPNVWNTVTGNPAVVVAVVDTGLRRSLPDFRRGCNESRPRSIGIQRVDARDGYVDHERSNGVVGRQRARHTRLWNDCRGNE